MGYDKLAAEIDQKVDAEVKSLLEKLGYKYRDGMSLEEYQALEEALKSHQLFLDIKTNQRKNSLTVAIKLTKLLKFNLT